MGAEGPAFAVIVGGKDAADFYAQTAKDTAAMGADVYVSSSLYAVGEERRSDLHLGARAMDNRVFTLLANYAGRSGPYESCGLSGAWTPTGEVLARVPDASEALLLVDLDPAALRPFRAPRAAHP